MPTITFRPSGIRVAASAGETIFEAGRRGGVMIDTACVGQGTCGRCRVKVLAGEANLPPVNATEVKHLGNVYFITKVRLSCQCPVAGDVEVEVPEPRPAKPKAPPPRAAPPSKPRPDPRREPLRDRRRRKPT